jgi:hypothetical protein
VGEVVEIREGLNGPPASGQGGYVCGLVSGLLSGPAEVSLRAPTPVGKPLQLERTATGAELRDGETLIAEGRSIDALGGEGPEPVGAEEAERARGRFEAAHESVFGHCFVCGTVREDSQRVWAGPVDDRSRVATPWTPSDDWLGDGAGAVRAEFVWAVLDCPPWFAVHLDRPPTTSMLVRLAVQSERAVQMGEPHVIVSSPISVEGRKQLAAAAVFTGAGDLCARGEALMIEVDEVPAEASG